MVKKGGKLLLVFLLLLFFVIFSFSTVFAATSASEANVSYDPDLMKAFDDRSYANQLMLHLDFIGLKVIDGEVWAKVIVRLKDNSGIIFNGTKEERLEQSKQKDAWFGPVLQSTLDELNKTGIKDINKSPFNSSFNALITKDGLEEIASNPNVKKIIWPQYGPELFLGSSRFGYLIGGLSAAIFLILLIVILISIFNNKRRKRK
jgi:hypothetical protein